MAKHLKTYLAGAILAGIALMPVLVAAWFCISQALVYRQMEIALELEALETITLKSSDITWLKAGKEILLGDKPFDVKNIYTTGDKSIITGLYDHREKALKEKLRSLENNTEQKNNFVKITRSVILFAPEPGNSLETLHFFAIYKANNFCYKVFFRQNDYSQIIAPPPRKFFTTLV